MTATTPAASAMTDEQILQIAIEQGLKVRTGQGAIKFARALIAAQPVAAAPVAQAALPKTWREQFADRYPNYPQEQLPGDTKLSYAEKEIADLRAALQQRQAPAECWVCNGAGVEFDDHNMTSPCRNQECSAQQAEAAPVASAEPIYQVQYQTEKGSSAWHDATEDAYHTFMPERRRIVYVAQAAPAPTAEPVAYKYTLLANPHGEHRLFMPENKPHRYFDSYEDARKWSDHPGVLLALYAAPAEQDLRDAARWRMLPAFFEDYQINAVKLLREVDAALATTPSTQQEKSNG